MATLDVKFTKFDNRPWGFRLAGGSDFPQPLTVIRVTEESLAECMGLKVGDVVVKLNDQLITDLTHGQAHEALTLAGNNFVLGVRRTEDPSKTVESIEDNIEPYMLPIEEILFAPIEETRETTPNEAPQIEDECVQPVKAEQADIEIYPEKPRDENSDIVPNTNLTEEEIAQLILDEEEILNEKGVLGVNFKKLRPRAPLFKQSKVFKELQEEVNSVNSDPAEAEKRRLLASTFLQKPERPIPKPQSEEKTEPEVEPYRVVIKKQPKKSITKRLLEQGLLEPSRVKTPEVTTQATEKTTPPTTPELDVQPASSETESHLQPEVEVPEIVDSTNAAEEKKEEASSEQTEQQSALVEEPADCEEPASCNGPADSEEPTEQVTIRRPSNEVDVEVAVTLDRNKIKELVTTEISLERQLESVQSQLLALKQLPSEIEKHLQIVSEQLHKIMALSGVEQQQRQQQLNGNAAQEAEERAWREEQEWREEERRFSELEDGRQSSLSSSYAANLISEEDSWTESKELEISVKSSEDDGKRVKKYIVSYESKVLQENQETLSSRSRESSPALTQGSFEADPKLTLHDQLVQELKHRKGRKRPRELWQPQAKQLELTYGRRWRCPNDFFNDEMIADVLSSQAEVIRGRAMGVNFKKFERKALPNYDHLMNSSVYKMIHKMEAEPKKGIPARPPKVVAAEDIIERVNTPDCCMMDDRSLRSVSH